MPDTTAHDFRPPGSGHLWPSPGGDGMLEKPGDSIGPFRLLSILGEGGFGIVWLAERREPIVQRVALKIIKPGMDSRAVIARFEQERQALAVMDHPNVSKVFDAGATPAGRPYFVMEHVQGEPITAFCDRHTYTIRQRLELFIPVCEAVQHSHQKGVIHRDIKPTNILVTLRDGQAVPKVIDFGVAKAISRSLTEKTIFTEQGQVIGTPEYMSPEQAEMGSLDVDTRTDIYSLGVVLYELLAGILPFDPDQLRSGGMAGLMRALADIEPPRPSRKLSTCADAAELARRRGCDPQLHRRTLQRELEWIPAKAMQKQRSLRYDSASAMIRDIRAYLNGDALDAVRRDTWGAAAAFVRRHRKAVSTATAVALLLLAATGVCAWMARRAIRAEGRAHERWVESDTLRMAEQASRARAEAFADEAEAMVRANLDVMRSFPGTYSAGSIDQTLAQLATLLDRRGLPEEAAPLVRELVDRSTAALGPAHPTTEAYRRELERVATRAAAPDIPAADPELALQRAYRRFELRHVFAAEIVAAAQTAADVRTEIRAPLISLATARGDTPDRLNRLAWTIALPRGAGAEAMQRALRAVQFAAEAQHDDGRIQNTLGVVLYRLGRYDDAIAALRRSTQLLQQMGLVDPLTDHIANPVFTAMSLARLGRTAEARTLLEEARRQHSAGAYSGSELAPTLFAEAQSVIDER